MIGSDLPDQRAPAVAQPQADRDERAEQPEDRAARAERRRVVR